MNASIHPTEFELEHPQQPFMEYASDTVLIYGGNTSGDRLLAKVSRERDGHLAWLLLVLSDGRTFELPYPEKSYPSGSTFVAGGLRMKCFLPMRKWRVSFNGLLREKRKTKGSIAYSKISHVKFSFICLGSCYAFDLSTDINQNIFADYMAKQKTFPIDIQVNRVEQHFNNYIQSCSLLGTVSVEGNPETEVYIYGAKKRSREIISDNTKAPCLLEVIGYTKDGQLLYAGEYQFPAAKTPLPFGYYLERTTLSWPVTKCDMAYNKMHPFNGMKIHVETERSSTTVDIESPVVSLIWISGHSSRKECHVHLSDMRLEDGDFGHAVFIENTRYQRNSEKGEIQPWRLSTLDLDASTPEAGLAVVSLDDPRCQNPSLCGGKGSSLASLTHLTQSYVAKFKVPSGFVLTTHAYWDFFTKAGLAGYVDENLFYVNAAKGINEVYNKLVMRVSSAELPETIKSAIKERLHQIFPHTLTSTRFAVRSSALGEDSEEMSAAGQMSTILGVQGLQNIFEAVKKCWASQFSFSAIQYKRQNGQELNSDMAVVVQEMVPADTAGVLFTCDPVTGNPQNVTITANYGLGESVVSASAEPDTIVMLRDERNQVTLKSVQVGRKKTKVIMSDGGNVTEKAIDEKLSSVSCLSQEKSRNLTEISLKIEEAYGFPLDLEWAFKGNELFFLQARPVTTCDTETKFEIAHSSDTAMRIEDEHYTRANVGEVFPGFTSHLGISFYLTSTDYAIQKEFVSQVKYSYPANPFCLVSLSCTMNHFFFSMTRFLLRYYKKDAASFLAEASIIASFGRVIENPEMFDQAARVNKDYPASSSFAIVRIILGNLLFSKKRLEKSRRHFWNSEIDFSKCVSARKMYLKIWNSALHRLDPAIRHMFCTLNSTIYNNAVLSILAKDNKGWDTNVFSDFALILSSCGVVESADVPFSMQILVKDIQKCIDPDQFRNMEPHDALAWIQNPETIAGKQFAEFLRKHGHRGLKEFDIYAKTWRQNSLPLIKILQDTISQVKEESKKFLTASDVISKMKVNLSRKSRFLLKLVIPMCRNAVVNRERSKSLWIKSQDCYRKAFWKLGDKMVEEGRLPEPDLLFFLNHHEVLQLIDTRSPSLLQRAKRRRQLSAEINNYKFPEISKGIPKSMHADTRVFDDLGAEFEIIGTPVSQGVAKAKARVATCIEEAADIQEGEILIAYSTDIAWSPYFPLLSGVATELGGLISHGAVVAREYGLPCVVAVHDATLRFKTGDEVLLDGNKGILKLLRSSGTSITS